jgi:hypothetical protein
MSVPIWTVHMDSTDIYYIPFESKMVFIHKSKYCAYIIISLSILYRFVTLLLS